MPRHNKNKNELMNASLRGWTQYGAKKQNPFDVNENNEDI